MKISVSNFKGIAPKINPKNLPQEFSTKAVNCEFDIDAMKGLRQDLPQNIDVKVDSTTEKIWFYNRDGKTKGYAFSHLADVIPAFENLKEKLFYFIGKDKIMYVQTDKGKTFKAGVPKPYVVELTTGKNLPHLYWGLRAYQSADHKKEKDKEVAAYRISLVDNFNNEGGLSKSSNFVDVSEIAFNAGKFVELIVKVNEIGEGFNIDPQKIKVRIYRSNTGTKETYWQYVGTIILELKKQKTFKDTLPSAKLEETAITSDWYPPEKNITNLITLASGSSCISYDNIVSVSVKNVPTAFPNNQRYFIPQRSILSIKDTEGGVLVFTNIDIYLLAGEDPKALTTTKVIHGLTCLNKDSVSTIGDKIIFTAKEGLFVIHKYKPTNVTHLLFEYKYWQSLNFKNSRSFTYYNTYILATENKTYEFEFSDNKLNIIENDKRYKYIATTDTYEEYISLDKRNEVAIFRDSAKRRKARWVSKEFYSAQKTIYTCVRLYAEKYPVGFKLYGDKNLIYSQDIYSDKVLKIRSLRKCREWQFEIEFKYGVYSVELGSSTIEILGQNQNANNNDTATT